MKKSELNYLINNRVEKMVSYLMEDTGMSLLEAFDKVYNSRTYALLTDTRTGLYFQSPAYVYSYLQEE